MNELYYKSVASLQKEFEAGKRSCCPECDSSIFELRDADTMENLTHKPGCLMGESIKEWYAMTPPMSWL
jgi:hypothetical protein